MNFPAIADLLPHQGNMVFLDGIDSHDQLNTQCHLTWPADSPYSDRTGNLPPALLVEAAAQCVGVHAGLKLAGKDQELKGGFLIALDQAEIHPQAVPAGLKLTLATEEVWLDGNYGVFTVTIRDDQNMQYFSGKLKVLQTDQ